MRISNRWWVAALALMVGSAAQAQIKFPEAKPKPGQPPPGQPAPPQTQPAPGTQPAPQTQTPAKTGGLSPEQQASLAALAAHNAFGAQAGQIATQRAASPEVRELGQRLVQDHVRIQRELHELAQERSIDVDALPRSPQQAQSFDAHVRHWQSLSGPEFDRVFVAQVKDLKIGWENELKHFRDVTPGKDARLKKWADDVENVAEEHKALARRTEEAIRGKGGQAQGRTPPRQ